MATVGIAGIHFNNSWAVRFGDVFLQISLKEQTFCDKIRYNTYITLHYIALHCITLHYITYIHICIPHNMDQVIPSYLSHLEPQDNECFHELQITFRPSSLFAAAKSRLYSA